MAAPSSSSSSNPPVLPITNPSNPTNPSNSATPAASRLFITRLASAVRSSLSRRKPWSELVDRSGFSRPDSATVALSRLRSNLSYFRVNYAILISLALAFSLLSHPFSLLLILSLLFAWSSLYLFRPSDSPPLVVLGRQFSDKETLAGLVLISVVVFFMTSVGSLIISALMVGAGIVCVHGAFRMPEDLFLDDLQEGVGGAAGGLLSFLGGAGAGAGAGAGSGVRV